MAVEFWQRVKVVFDHVWELEPHARFMSLDQMCGGEDAVREEVRQMLLALDGVGEFMEAPLLLDAEKFSAGEHTGRRFGPYQLVREIGRGGMGEVYLAVRADDAYQKEVAVKVVWSGYQSSEIWRRFVRERQILASLEHPNIARLLDGGTTEDGVPYLVMEYIEGVPVTDYCDQYKLSINERLRLFCTICAAVQYAHQNLVIHRDLKPANILVTGQGVIKLLDFGVAKILKPDLDGTPATLTRAGLHFMTPEYSSPEQVSGAKVTTASDVYSLGVVLYELLTGQRPYRVESRLLHEVVRAVCEVEPERPSSAVRWVETRAGSENAGHTTRSPGAFSQRREVSPERLRNRLTGDLDNIVLMALNKEPERRYQTVEQLSEDIKRHLEGGTVLARKATLFYRTERFIRRYRALVIATLLTILILCLGIISEMRQTRIAEALAKQNRQLLYEAEISLAQQSLRENNIRRAHDLLERQKPASGEEDLRGFEWRYLQSLSHQESVTLPDGGEILAIALSPNGRLLATANGDHSVKVWDLTKREKIFTLKGHQDKVWASAFSIDGKVLATGSSDATVRLWGISTGNDLAVLNEHTKTVKAIAFTPDGRWMLTAGEDLTIRRWDVNSHRVVSIIKAHSDTINSLAVSPDGELLVTGSSDSKAILWKSMSGQKLAEITIPTEQIRAVTFSPNSRLVALAPTGPSVFIWDPLAGKIVAKLATRESTRSIAFSTNGKIIATGSGGHATTLWDVAEKRELISLPGHLDIINSVAFSSSGMTLATGSKDGTVKIWEPAKMIGRGDLRGHDKDGAVWALTLSRDGKRLFSGGDDNFIRIWDIIGEKEIRAVHTQFGKIRAIALSPDERYLATGTGDFVVRIWDMTTWHPIKSFSGHQRQIRSLSFSPDGKLLASASEDQLAKVWETASGKEVATLRDHTDRVRAVCFSPDSQTVATAGDDRRIIFWSVQSWQRLFTLEGHTDSVIAAMYSPDGTKLVTGSSDYTALMWDLKSRKPVRKFTGHAKGIWGVALSPDGKRLATASGDQTVRIWNVATGGELLNIQFPFVIRSVIFTPDSNRLLLSGDAGMVRILYAQ